MGVRCAAMPPTNGRMTHLGYRVGLTLGNNITSLQAEANRNHKGCACLYRVIYNCSNASHRVQIILILGVCSGQNGNGSRQWLPAIAPICKYILQLENGRYTRAYLEPHYRLNIRL